MANYQTFFNLTKELNKYPTPTDLIYRYKFTHQDLDIIYKEKYSDKRYTKLPLKNEDNTKLLFLKSRYIINKLSDSEDLINNTHLDFLINLHDDDLINGFIFSEIESSLAIEGIRSTRSQIEKINTSAYKDLKSSNEIIVKNMLNAYSYIQTNSINKENILTLYNIISNNCLKEDEKLLQDNYYRHEEVEIIGINERVVDKGVNHIKLNELMDDLIKYIHTNKSLDDHNLAPHIIHYYLIYLHPYFDYNGRMARVLSYWYSIQYNPLFSSLFISEAINNPKNKTRYYNAISLSRKTNNDITYFLEYMADIIIEYSKVYINYYNILETLLGNGEAISKGIQNTLKTVLIMYSIKDDYFDWKKYKLHSSDNFSKVQYLKNLNKLLDLNILIVKKQKKVNLYKLNSKMWNII